MEKQMPYKAIHRTMDCTSHFQAYLEKFKLNSTVELSSFGWEKSFIC